ncbi:27751_t:CDS:2, partial [Gigaspora margarita]
EAIGKREKETIPESLKEVALKKFKTRNFHIVKNLQNNQKITKIDGINKAELDKWDQEKKMKNKNVPVRSEVVMNNKPELVSLEKKEDKEKNLTENLRLTYLSKDKKEALADLKNYFNKVYEWHPKHIKEEKTTFELNMNHIKDKCSKTKDLEELKNNQQENYVMKSAKETLSNEAWKRDKITGVIAKLKGVKKKGRVLVTMEYTILVNESDTY